MPPADYPLVTVGFHDGADCNVDLQLDQALTALGLAGQVRTLGEYGVIEKRVVNPVCKHSEYSLTELGRTLIPIIEQLRSWGNDFRPRMQEILQEKGRGVS